MDRSSWRFLLPESIVIVASILVAFGIQAWWEESQEDEEAARMLEAVLLEHRSNLQAIATYDELMKPIIQAYLDLSSLTDSDQDLDSERIDGLISKTIVTRAPLMSWGAFESLVAGGRLSIIDNPALRKDLANWYSYFRSNYEIAQKEETDYLNNQYAPYLAGIGALAQVRNPPIHPDALHTPIVLPVGQLVDTSKLPRDPEFLSHIQWKLGTFDMIRAFNALYIDQSPDLEQKLLEALGEGPLVPEGASE